MSLKQQKIVYTLGFIASISSSAVFSQASKVDLQLGVYTDTFYDTNANKVDDSDGVSQLSEQQNLIGLDFGALYSGNLLQYTANYNAVKEEFTRDSQEEDHRFTGESKFDLGNKNTFYNLSLSHDVRRLLNSPEDSAITGNTAEQNTISVIPALQTNRAKSNSLRFSGIYAKTLNEDEGRDNVTQTGGEIDFQHLINAYRIIGLKLQSSESAFELASDLDYRYARGALYFSSELRNISFDIEAGVAAIEPLNGDDERTSFYQIDVSYDNTNYSLSLASSVDYSNSSTNQGLSDFSNDVAIGSEVGDQDQIKIQSNQLSFSTDSLCSVCSLSLNYDRQKIGNFNLKENDTVSDSAQLLFSYELSTRSSLRFRATKRDVKFINDAARDVLVNNYNVSYQKNWTANFTTSFYVGYVERKDDFIPYKGELFGLKLNYQLQ